ncbi:MAG: transposase [Pseudomonadales bacterium]|nr:transposase [Pseudomonadales bacterium]MCP5184693.1 transposase [Pseudomonadales bacterium]
MSRGMRHPFSRALYELDGDGNVLVTDGERQGTFDGWGRWISGELREADPQFCLWITNVPEPMMNSRKTHTLDG